MNFSILGGLSIGVPGEIKGYYVAWKRFGKMPWKDLFLPTIQMCEQGYKINSALSRAIISRQANIREDANLRLYNITKFCST